MSSHSTASSNRRTLQQRLTALATVPQIPADLASDAANNQLSTADEQRMDAAIAAATWAIHERRKFKEDSHGAYTPREFVTVEVRGNLLGVRAVG